MWRTRLGQLGVEALDLLDPAADHVVAERDLGLQPPGVGEVDRQRVVVVGLGLADVVQQRAGDGDVAVDAGEQGRGGADALGDRDGVLEQPAGVGLVVVLRRRRGAEARPVLGLRAEEAVKQPAQLGALDGRDQVAQVLPRDGRPGVAGASARASGSYSSDSAGRIDSIVICLPNCWWTEKRPATMTTPPGCAASKHSATAIPGDRGHGPGAVGEDQPQEVLAVALLAQVALADREGRPRPPGRPSGGATRRSQRHCRLRCHCREESARPSGS